jgi:hypothetical protein
VIREARPDEADVLSELQPNPIDVGCTIELETTLATP